MLFRSAECTEREFHSSPFVPRRTDQRSAYGESEERAECFYAGILGVKEEDASYLWSEHVSTSNTYSEKADTIDILYSDGTVRDIAEASEILDLEALTRKPTKRYLFKFRVES